MYKSTKFGKMIIWLVSVLVIVTSEIIAEEEPKPIFYVPFEDSAEAVIARGNPESLRKYKNPKFEPGMVDKASRGAVQWWEGRGNICLDRGTIAFSFKPRSAVVEYQNINCVTSGSITNYSSLVNDIANGASETNGWYARNHGRLVLNAFLRNTPREDARPINPLFFVGPFPEWARFQAISRNSDPKRKQRS